MATRSPRGRDTGRNRPSGRPAAPRAAGSAKKRTSPGTGPQITTRAVLLLSVVLLLVGSYSASLRAWWGARQELQTTRAERTILKEQIADLENEKGRFDDPAFIKAQARQRFGWVMPGEMGYRVIGADGAVRGEVPTLDAPPSTASDEWYDTLWGTVTVAGDPEAAVAPTPTDQQPLENDQ